MGIGIQYSCSLCGIKDVEVNVRLRESDEDVIHYMETAVIVALGADHRERSPDCHPQTLTNIKIPIDGGRKFIGGPVEN